MAHTPGPWEVLGPYPSITVGVEFAPDQFDIVADIWDHKDGEAPENAKDNARLIAKAPDMLAALETIVKIIDGSQPKDYPGALMVAQSAINKVKEA